MLYFSGILVPIDKQSIGLKKTMAKHWQGTFLEWSKPHSAAMFLFRQIYRLGDPEHDLCLVVILLL